MAIPFLLLATVYYLILVPISPCPVRCRCVIHSARPSADCSYRELNVVPSGFPPNLTQLSLSVNYISGLNTTSFGNIFNITSLWLPHNQIIHIDHGTFRDLVKLISLDLSHNKLTHFPWSDLSNLSNLQVLSLNNNQLVMLPRDAFKNSQALRSLQISSNKLSVLAEGMFDAMTSLSHLQIYGNPFNCTCSLEWLKDWMGKVRVTIDKKRDIACSYPKQLKGVPLDHIPDLQCNRPLNLQGDDPFFGKDLLICEKFGVHNLRIHMDTQASSYSQGHESKSVFTNRSIVMTPPKQSTIYLCRVFNHTTGTQREMSISLAHIEEKGWLQEQSEKFLLVLVSEGGGVEVSTGSRTHAAQMLWLAKVVVWSLILICH